MKAAVVTLLVAILGCLGYMIYDREREKTRVAVAQELVVQAHVNEAQERARIEEAILARKAVTGMTKQDLRKAWRDATVDVRRYNMIPEWVEIGVYEEWHPSEARYGFAGLDVNGVVIRTSKYVGY